MPTEEQVEKYGIGKLLEVRMRKASDKAVEGMRGIRVSWPESKPVVEEILGRLRGVVTSCGELLSDADEEGCRWECVGLRDAVSECESWLRELEGKKKVLDDEEDMLIVEESVVQKESNVEKILEEESILEKQLTPEQELMAENESTTEAKDTPAEERLAASTSSVLSLLRESRPKSKCEECGEVFDRFSRLKSHYVIRV